MTATRRTIAARIQLAGLALFTEAECRVTLSPGDHAIRLSRPGGPHVRLSPDIISDAPARPLLANLPPRHTCIRTPTGDIATVEHLLSAIVGCAITDIDIEVDGPEIPIFDGSAAPFVELLHAAGTAPLAGSAPMFRPSTTLSVADGRGATITLEPADQLSFEYKLDYEAAASPAPLPPQSATWDASPAAYAREIAPARTFSFEHEARAMHALGLFRSFTPRDFLVIAPQGPIDNTLRFPDEPARHKLLDLIGDLALAGVHVQGRIVAHRAGHRLNHEMARRIRDAAGLA